jgi:hypothetical protein
MTIPGKARLYPRNIAEGYAPFTRAASRRLSAVQMKTLHGKKNRLPL